MRLYAQHPALRLRQLAADAGLLVWIVGWVLAARAAHGAVLLLAGPGKAVEDLGRSVGGSMDSAAGVAEDVPLVGDELATPFDALARASGSVRGAGQSAQDAVDTLALILAVALVVLPVGWMLLRWLPWRTRWVREATAAQQVLSGTSTGGPDLELLAARALATAPLPRLAALPPGTGAAWRAGDPAAVRSLATLELDRLGLRLPDAGARTLLT
ncbi:hypothetical protein SAMN05660748_2055 [Blastococcus aggregatus]|uniref:Uncharacterized protein n=1 Tax=Blastococcus aggregatus TaxID=38502 RepID=A0A285V5C5_9ACTN|nr:hypothetical protein [Blastococcus aggregatus]SOC49334.1 hypothetical protein SAMN05660748_2055 [Blastococcus aggregatus]